MARSRYGMSTAEVRGAFLSSVMRAGWVACSSARRQAADLRGRGWHGAHLGSATGRPGEHRCGNRGRWWEWRSVRTGRDLLRGDRARSGYGMVFPVKRSVCWPVPIPCTAWRSARTASGSWAGKSVDHSGCGNASTGDPISIPAWNQKTWIPTIAISRDGTRIISGEQDGLRFWDAATLQPIGDLRRDQGWVTAIGVSPTGDQIASAGWDRTVRFWDPRTGSPVGEPIRGHDGLVSSLAYSADGNRLLSKSSDGTVWISSLTNNQSVIATRAGGRGCALKAAVSPDAKYIVAASNCGGGQVFDGVSRTQVGDLATHVQGNVRSAAFSPTASNIVAATSRETITLLMSSQAEPSARSCTDMLVASTQSRSVPMGKGWSLAASIRWCASGMWKRAIPSAHRCRVIKRSRSVSCSFPTGPSSRRAARVASCVGLPTPAERLASHGVGRGSEVSR